MAEYAAFPLALAGVFALVRVVGFFRSMVSGGL